MIRYWTVKHVWQIEHTSTDLHRVRVQVSLGQLVVKLNLQLPSIQVGLGQLIVKLSLLISVVVGQLVKRGLHDKILGDGALMA